MEGVSTIPGLGSFSMAAYWNSRYSTDATCLDQTEWIFNFDTLKSFISLSQCKLLVDVGCGISPLLHGISSAGYKGRCLGIDFSSVAVELAAAKFRGVEYVCADAESICKITGEDMVDIIIDKTTIDSMLCGGPKGRAKVIGYCEQAGKALRDEGVFIWATFQGLEPYGMDIVNGTIIPGLSASTSSHGLQWSADVHIWDDVFFENPDLKPTLYIFTKQHISPRFLGHDVAAVEMTMHYH